MEKEQREWVEFENGMAYRRPQKNRPHISINKRGNIFLNSYLMKKLRYPQSASLYYNAETGSIGILPHVLPKGVGNSFRIVYRPNYHLGRICAQAFLRSFGVTIDNTIATSAVQMTPQGMLIVDLRQAYAVAFRRKPARSSNRLISGCKQF